MDPDRGSPKTCGSCGFGSGSGSPTLLKISAQQLLRARKIYFHFLTISLRDENLRLTGKNQEILRLAKSSVADPDLSDSCFWASWIRILLLSSKNSKKNLDYYCFVTSF
jgi:hypothetical protein